MKNPIFKGFLMVLASGSILCSCSSDELLDSYDETEKSVEFINVSYKGKTYKNVPYTYDNEGNIQYLESEFADIYHSEIEGLETWSIYAKSSDEIEYYSSLEENLKSHNLQLIERISEGSLANGELTGLTTRGYENLAELYLYDDKKFIQPYYKNGTLNITYPTQVVKERRLKDSKFNDKCSSVKIVNNLPNSSSEYIKLGDFNYPCSKIVAVFTGHENKDYSKGTIILVCPSGSATQYWQLNGFNDKLSSYTFELAQSTQFSQTQKPDK